MQSDMEMQWEPAKLQQSKPWEHPSALPAGWDLPERCRTSPMNGPLQRRRMLGHSPVKRDDWSPGTFIPLEV